MGLWWVRFLRQTPSVFGRTPTVASHRSTALVLKLPQFPVFSSQEHEGENLLLGFSLSTECVEASFGEFPRLIYRCSSFDAPSSCAK